MRQIEDIWPGSFAWQSSRRRQIGRYRVVRGTLRKGMVVEAVRVEPYFHEKSGWTWRKKRGTAPVVLVVIAVAADPNGTTVTADRVKRNPHNPPR